jgi:ABC-type protease/lipase transport system fused ATPase/permease subunit
MKRSDRAALREAISDTAVGTLINFPLNLIVLSLAFSLQFTVFWTAVISWFTFTVIAIIRKYYIRKFFDKKNS